MRWKREGRSWVGQRRVVSEARRYKYQQRRGWVEGRYSVLVLEGRGFLLLEGRRWPLFSGRRSAWGAAVAGSVDGGVPIGGGQ